jgi:hypothetical protein
LRRSSPDWSGRVNKFTILQFKKTSIMKRIIFTVIVFAFLANVSAQLKVNSTGRVGIGTTNPQYKLDVTGDARVTGNIYLGSSSNIATTNNVPIRFKVDSVLSGSTGNSGNYNVFFGYKALSSNSSGFWNTAFGALALSSNSTGGLNTAIGENALFANRSGNYNTANGGLALAANKTGSYNAATGTYALYSSTTGDGNTAHGAWALYSTSIGSGNTANGNGALLHNTTGSYNTAIGYYAALDANDLSNSTVIGYDALATSSNQVRIGNSSVTSIGGYAAWSNLSDKRAKKNIREDVPGLAFINHLQPVTYNLDLDAIDGLLKIDRTKKRPGEADLSPKLIEINKKAKEAKEKVIQTGFIAQDVEAIAKSIGYDFSGVDVDESGIYGLRYAEFVVPLVKAVQELSEQNDLLQAQNDRMQEQINELAGLLGKELKSATGLQELTANGATLQQNVPNPFSQSTVIRYTLPQTGKSAQIVITASSGNVIRQIPLSSGTDRITIEGGALSAGIYYYSLYVAGSLIDTKQMILTK